MMFPPIFQTLSAASSVTALVGTNPVRVYPFGEAPQGVLLPYVVWQTVYGSPENVLDGAPDVDSFTLQIDVYGNTAASVRNVATALRDVIEPVAHIVGWRGESKDVETKNYRYSFDVDWMVER